MKLMGDDVDVAELYTWLKGVRGVDLSKAMKTAGTNLTMEGASTVKITIVDHDRVLLRSGKLSSRQVVHIDGLPWVLASVSKDTKILDLVWEPEDIYLLRKYDSPIKQSSSTSRGTNTRAQFILRMIQEVKEKQLKWFIPDLAAVQPTDTASPVLPGGLQLPATPGVQKGIPQKNDLTVQHEKMTDEQRANANIALTVGTATGATRKILVVSMMTAIQESGIKNLDYGHPGDYNYLSTDNNYNPVGVFQQIKAYGWPASRDVGVDAKGFFDKANKYAISDLQYFEIAEAVQGSGRPRAYAQWRREAERIVTAFGEGSSTVANNNDMFPDFSSTGDYEFYRGIPPTSVTRKQRYGSRWGPETSWDCINRLSDEVQKRFFWVEGVLYYIADVDLFKSVPIAVLDEETEGVDKINGDYDEGRKTATATVYCRARRWAAPPGTVIQLRNMGPWNGRWLVSNISRPLTSPNATVLLKKPLPKLPEPSGTNIIGSANNTWGGTPIPTPPPGLTKSYVFPIPANVKWWEARIDMGKDLETGIAGIGWPLLAIGDGTIVRISDGGGFGPWYTVLLFDPDWALTRSDHPVPADATPSKGFTKEMALNAGKAVFYGHCAKPIVQVGQSVKAGQPIIHIKGVGSGGVPLPDLPGHMELGWAVPSGGYTMLAASHYTENDHTPEGYDFWEFLKSIKDNLVTLPPGAKDTF